jgi:ABC-2 type transport system permease protein
MRELGIVLRREFLERVRTKSFMLSTLLTPLFFLLIMLGPVLSQQLIGGDEKEFAVLDEAGQGFGEEVATALSALDAGSDSYRATAVTAGGAAVRDSLIQAVLREELDGVITLPPDLLEGGAVQYRALSVTDVGLQRRIAGTVSNVVQGRRLATAGIDQRRLAAIMAPVRLEAARLTSEGGTGESAESGMLFSIMVGFALYMLILLYGVQVLQSVQEEKTNRIAEILVSSIKASHLMLGKVLGVGLAALLQVAIWLALAAALSAPIGSLMQRASMPPGLFSGLLSRVDPMLVAVVVAYLLLGFFLYASLFAAAGAAAASSEDAQRFTFPLIMPLIIPMMMTGAIVSAPRDTLAVVLGWIPLTMPLAMPMRIGAGGTTSLEVAASLVVLAASVVLLGVIAGKIYRIGILSTGKRPTMRELARWLRMA